MGLKISQLGSRGIPGHRGGVERVVEAIAPRLVALGHDVTVYCASWSKDHAPSYKGVKLSYVRSIESKYFDTFVRSFLSTLREIFGSSDVVHFHGSGSAPLALLARMAGKRTVVTVHGLDWQRRKWNAIGEWFLRVGQWAAVKIPHRTIVVGPDLKKILDEHYKTDVTYIPNGVEERTYRTPNSILQYKIGHRNYILYLARLVPEKQCHVLIEAFAGMSNKAGMKLVIAGPTWHSKDYVQSLHKMAANHADILFTGEVDEATLEELYSNCYAYVLPSEVEGMSLSLLDAMAFGACIVSSDIPANSYVIGDSGISFKTGDVEDLRIKLDDIAKRPVHADRLRLAAKQRMTNEFHWDKIAKDWDHLYRTMTQ